MPTTKKINRNVAIANKILEIIKSKDLDDWQQGWDPTKSGVCKNAKTGQIYRGLNFLRLHIEKEDKKYTDNRWLTYRQAQDLGGSVKPGEKATEIAFYSQWDKKLKKYFNQKDIDYLPYEEQQKYIQENVTTFLKSYFVFNVEQCENLKLEKEVLPSEEELKKNSNEICDNLVEKSEAPIYYDQIDSAFYSPTSDSIHVPQLKTFNSMEDFYATICHEIIHSTGHSSRLKRKLNNKFGTREYAFEELVAELGSLMFQSQAGIKIDGKHLNNHASYIRDWLDHTKKSDQPYELIKASSCATKAVDYVIKNMLNKSEIISKKDLKDKHIINSR